MSGTILKSAYPKALQALLGDSSETIEQLLQKDSDAAYIFVWLAKLKLLHGVPFRYLVPDERMLPPESIKFFNLDINWVNALVDGAYSIGNHAAKNVDNQTLMSQIADYAAPKMHGSCNNEARNIRPNTFNIAKSTNKDAFSPISGFMLRSEVVSGWPGVQVTAFAKDYYPGNLAGNKPKNLKPLRIERLSNDLLIGLFDGQAYRIDIHEPSEGLHFGFDLDKQTHQLSKNLRKPTNPGAGTRVSDVSVTPKDLEKNGIFRAYKNQTSDSGNKGGQVVNMYKMSSLLYDKLNASKDEANHPIYKEPLPHISVNGSDVDIVSDQDANPLVSSDFALQMIEGVGNVSFYNIDENDEVKCGKK